MLVLHLYISKDLVMNYVGESLEKGSQKNILFKN